MCGPIKQRVERERKQERQRQRETEERIGLLDIIFLGRY